MPEKNVEKATRHEIRLAGSGGQGIIMAAIVLAEAAGVHEGKQVSQTQSYGPEARGGTCKAEVVISDAPIDYPKVSRPDFLLAMNQASVNTYFGRSQADGAAHRGQHAGEQGAHGKDRLHPLHADREG